MYKLVIVEDELIVRKNIIKKIEWEKYGFQVVGEAENGAEAVEVIDAVKPDVIISDIEMPFMNGLELAKIVRDKYPTMKIIILTGYDEFKYAQSAIELEVIEYILKPVSSEGLIKTITKIKQQIDVEILEKENLELLRQNYLKSIPIVRGNFLNDLITNIQDKEEIADKASYLDIDLNCNSFFCSVIYIDKNSINRTNFTQSDYELIKFAVLNTTIEIIDKYNLGYVISNEKYVIVVSLLKEDNKKFIEERLFKAFEEIRFSIEKYMKINVTIGIGNIVNSIEDISSSYKSAIVALDYRFIIGCNKFIYIEDLEPQGEDKIEFDDYKENLLLNTIKFGCKKEVNNAIESIFSCINDEKVSFNDYQVYLLELIASIVKLSKSLSIDNSKLFGKNYNLFVEMFKFNTLYEIKEWVKEICFKLMESISESRQSSCKLHVENAKKYVKENYANSEVSLNSVSNYLHISPSYFGALFKEETGETFISYLLRYRMKKTKDLMSTTNLKNYEIAEKVGYVDQHYFSYSFKKFFKVSPNEFRNSLNQK